MQFLPTLFLKAITILIGIGALAFLLVEPHFEGRNVNATLFEIYFNDPFLAYAYITSIPFFIALYQALKLLGSIERGEALSRHAVKALRIIRHCALAIVSFVVPGMIFIRFFSGSDDPAGGIAMGALIILGSLIAAATASTLERVARNHRALS